MVHAWTAKCQPITAPNVALACSCKITNALWNAICTTMEIIYSHSANPANYPASNAITFIFANPVKLAYSTTKYVLMSAQRVLSKTRLLTNVRPAQTTVTNAMHRHPTVHHVPMDITSLRTLVCRVAHPCSMLTPCLKIVKTATSHANSVNHLFSAYPALMAITYMKPNAYLHVLKGTSNRLSWPASPAIWPYVGHALSMPTTVPNVLHNTTMIHYRVTHVWRHALHRPMLTHTHWHVNNVYTHAPNAQPSTSVRHVRTLTRSIMICVTLHAPLATFPHPIKLVSNALRTAKYVLTKPIVLNVLANFMQIRWGSAYRSAAKDTMQAMTLWMGILNVYHVLFNANHAVSITCAHSVPVNSTTLYTYSMDYALTSAHSCTTPLRLTTHAVVAHKTATNAQIPQCANSAWTATCIISSVTCNALPPLTCSTSSHALIAHHHAMNALASLHAQHAYLVTFISWTTVCRVVLKMYGHTRKTNHVALCVHITSIRNKWSAMCLGVEAWWFNSKVTVLNSVPLATMSVYNKTASNAHNKAHKYAITC